VAKGLKGNITPEAARVCTFSFLFSSIRFFFFEKNGVFGFL
jgi:hypothetical protein